MWYLLEANGEGWTILEFLKYPTQLPMRSAHAKVDPYAVHFSTTSAFLKAASSAMPVLRWSTAARLGIVRVADTSLFTVTVCVFCTTILRRS